VDDSDNERKMMDGMEEEDGARRDCGGFEGLHTITLRYCGRDEFFVAVRSLEDLSIRIERQLGVAKEQQKLLAGGRMLKLQRGVMTTAQEEEDILALAASKKLMLLGAKKKDVEKVRAQREDMTLRGFDAEDERAKQRRGRGATTSSSSAGSARTSYFASIQELSLEGLTSGSSTPSADAAHTLLVRLATDPAIVSIMEKRRWRVGALRELPPQGKVGVSPVCLLGLNRNFGEEILLRIRTDDMKGFRKYKVIIETLLHELVHNEIADHNNDFKRLNSELTHEYRDFHELRLKTMVTGDGRDKFSGWDDEDDDAHGQMHAKDGRKLGSA